MTYYEKAISLLKKENIQTIIEILKEGSDEGEFRCSYQLANFYMPGILVPKDEEQSNHYFEVSKTQAEKFPENSDALFILGTIKMFGLGKTGVDKEEGMKCILKSAEMNNPDAMILLVNSYRSGDIVERNIELANEYAKRLYDMKIPVGIRLYAESFYFAEEGKRDYDKAFKYYQEAATKGDVKSIFSLGTCYFEGRGVEKNDEKAFAHFLKAAQSGFPDAMRNVAFFYNRGIGIERNYNKEIEWLERLVSINDSEGLYALACCYLDKGHGLFKYVEAIELLKRASDRNNVKAKVMLGHIYEHGQFGALPQLRMAFEYYNSAYSLGFKQVAYDLLRCYKEGIGVQPDRAKIAELEQVVEELERQKNMAQA